MTVRRALSAPLALGLAALVLAAKIETPAERTFAAAKTLEDRGQFSSALALYSEIPMRQWTPLVRLHIAVCKGKTGQLLAAQDELSHLAAESDDPAFHDVAESSRAAFGSETPVLAIHLTAASTEVVLTLDEREVAPGKRPVDPGPHVIEGTRKGARVFYRELTAERGKSIAVEIDAPAPSVPAVVHVDNKIFVQSPDGKNDHVSSIPSYLPWTLLGAGLVLGGGFALARVQTDQALSARQAYCATVRASACPDDPNKSAAVTWNTAGYVLLASALSVGATGVILWLIPSTKPSGVHIGWSGSSISLSGAF